MWVDIQKNYGLAFFNFSIWVDENSDEIKSKLNLKDETSIYQIDVEKQFPLILKYFKTKGLGIKLNEDLTLKKLNGEELYEINPKENKKIEISNLIKAGFKSINSNITSYRL